MSKCDFIFTVFTPTYNRADKIARVYDSLCSQTFKNFEWVIVDDGSSDDTQTLIKKWQNEADFSIRYFYQSNQGKHVAFNKGVNEAHGELFLTADSDDAFTPDALKKLYAGWESIPIEQREKFSAITVNCMDTHGKLIGTPFPKSPLDSDPEEIFFYYKVKGEKWGFHRTDVLKEFPFPEPKNIPFVSESYIWFRIARKYKTRFINDNLRIYYQDAGNQLTRRSLDHIALARPFYADTLNYSRQWFRYSPWIFYKIAAIYIRFCIHAKDSPRRIFSRVKGFLLKALLLSAYPAGVVLALRDQYTSRKNA